MEIKVCEPTCVIETVICQLGLAQLAVKMNTTFAHCFNLTLSVILSYKILPFHFPGFLISKNRNSKILIVILLIAKNKKFLFNVIKLG